jgi:hypothetical protein
MLNRRIQKLNDFAFGIVTARNEQSGDNRRNLQGVCQQFNFIVIMFFDCPPLHKIFPISGFNFFANIYDRKLETKSDLRTDYASPKQYENYNTENDAIADKNRR